MLVTHTNIALKVIANYDLSHKYLNPERSEGSLTEIEKKLKILWDFYLGIIEKFKVLIIY